MIYNERKSHRMPQI